MHTKFNFPMPENERTVYIRTVRREELPAELQAQVAPDTPLYAIHARDGSCLALAKNRHLAFALARSNEMSPVSVH